MKKFGYLTGAIGIAVFLFFQCSRSPDGSPSVAIPESVGREIAKIAPDPLHKLATKAFQNGVTHELTKAPPNDLAAENPGFNNFGNPEISANSIQFASTHYQEFFDSFRQEHESNFLHVEGKVKLAYGGFDGEFAVQFLIPSRSSGSVSQFVDYFAGISNPGVGSTGGGAIDGVTDGRNELVLTVPGAVITPHFAKKPNFDDLPLSDRTEEPDKISGVEFSVEPKRKRGTSSVNGQLNFDTKSPRVPIGTFKYVIH